MVAVCDRRLDAKGRLPRSIVLRHREMGSLVAQRLADDRVQQSQQLPAIWTITIVGKVQENTILGEKRKLRSIKSYKPIESFSFVSQLL